MQRVGAENTSAQVEDEYQFLTERLDVVDWAIDGSCDDVDCDHYAYKALLKEKHGPVLEHEVSCMPRLRSERAALLRILSLERYEAHRHGACDVCGERIDRLGKDYGVVAFTKKIDKYYELKTLSVHNPCRAKATVPEGWSFF